MLPKEQRLKRDRDFDRIFKKGEKVFSHPFTIRFEKTTRPLSRVAVVVGGKVSKKAVVRNRIRRQVREGVRGVIGSFTHRADVVISTLPAISEMTYQEMERSVKKALKKAGLLV